MVDEFKNALQDTSRLTRGELALRNKFVKEYLKDFNHVKAAMRCGFLSCFAEDWGRKLLEDPYVQSKIDAERSDVDPVETDKQMILRTLRECMANGQHGTRVAAAKAMMTILGMDKKAEDNTAAQDLVQAFAEFADKVK